MPLTLAAIAASAGLGALVGLIRQWSEQTKNEATDGPSIDFGGVRTHTFWGVLGCLGGAATERAAWALPVIIAAIASHQIVFRWRGPVPGNGGGTSFAAMLLTILAGTLVAWDLTQAAVLVTTLTMVTLGLKQPIHNWTRKFTAEDVRAALQFVAITGVVLPLVPNRAMGPFDGFNPYSTWLMVVLISGVGFAGYVAMRLFGTKSGVFVTSLLGGLASSTATTLAFSRRSKEDPDLSIHYAFAISTACTVMVPRVIAVIAVLNAPLAMAVAKPLLLMTLPAIVFGAWYAFRPSAGSSVASPSMNNPLSLRTSVKFALLYALFAFLVKAVTQLDLQSGLLPLSFISGLTDMDAIALSMADSQRGDGLPLSLAVNAIVMGAIANALLKAGMAVSLGSRPLRLPVGLVLGATAVVGAVTIGLN
ncbi:MgtC/SapB family protein [Synoicihabitans lomoniglobus]|uniref:MgtC/SapB family protein n=1 Tax=Synoicihabitans lomoniglobus TaxID=2909285 RepID=A0AAE9ZZ14_9BACT|nr:MgtC/SapB family protein [Opitutaceae bacterium LMO-M01]WED63067.1 MgtC/SapB family protein [Opitutaceae bacterium LMO-M01]